MTLGQTQAGVCIMLEKHSTTGLHSQHQSCVFKYQVVVLLPWLP